MYCCVFYDVVATVCEKYFQDRRGISTLGNLDLKEQNRVDQTKDTAVHTDSKQKYHTTENGQGSVYSGTVNVVLHWAKCNASLGGAQKIGWRGLYHLYINILPIKFFLIFFYLDS